MSRSGVCVVDLTTRLGEQAIGQVRTSPSTTGPRRSIALSADPGAPVLDWWRPPPHGEHLTLDDSPVLLILLLGPGSVQAARAIFRQAVAAGVPRIRVLVMPSAIVEELAMQSLVAPDDPVARLHRLPDSSPETLWFVLIEELPPGSGTQGLTPSPPAENLRTPMSTNLKQSMSTAMTIDGALAAALVDFRSGMCLAQAGTAMNLDLAAAGNTQVVRAKLQTMEALGLRKGIEDILITLTDQYHLIRLVTSNAGLFLYLVLDKNKSNLALARYKLTDIERALMV